MYDLITALLVLDSAVLVIMDFAAEIWEIDFDADILFDFLSGLEGPLDTTIEVIV